MSQSTLDGFIRERPSAKQREWLKDYSDHALLRLELESL